jgi:hypothetical protein
MPAAGPGQAAGSLARACRGMIQVGFAYSRMQGRGALARLGRTGRGGGRAESGGAKRGADNRRSRGASGYIQPLPGRPNGTSGDTWHHPATPRKCLSSRSRVRVAVGAQICSWLLIFENCCSYELLLAGSHSYPVHRRAGNAFTRAEPWLRDERRGGPPSGSPTGSQRHP